MPIPIWSLLKGSVVSNTTNHTFCEKWRSVLFYCRKVLKLLVLQKSYWKQCGGSGSGRIRTFLVGSWRLGPDPDPDLNKWLCINFFGVCKSHKYLRKVCWLRFCSMKILFRAYFHKKKCQKEVGRNFIRVRIRTFSKVGSGQKSSGSATLIGGIFMLISTPYKVRHCGVI
jgi:hypothetical protein